MFSLMAPDCRAAWPSAIRNDPETTLVEPGVLTKRLRDRFGTVTDPFGHVWSVATHTEDLTPEQIAERGREAMAAMG